jgi:hypothetical protein
MLRSFWTVAFMAVLIGAGPAENPSLDDKVGEVLAQWKPRLDEAKFNYLVCGPFVVAGDVSRRALDGYCRDTILAAQAALRRMYIDKDLQKPVVILLIDNDAEYRRVAKQWLAQEQPSHFGFYQPGRRVMLMNVSTGTGTLVHELTHALIEPDFPGVPSWFNEGFASLFEQCSIQGESIRGLINWRLPGLQSAISSGKLRSLREMMADKDFYAPARAGVNYAQARYLMLYLQEKGLLQKFYRSFRDRAGVDPTGVKVLEQTVGADNLNQFEEGWQRWVLGLRFEND